MKISNILSRRNRILLRELVVTDFKLRYQGSALGYLWSLLKPLMIFGIMYVIFIKFLRFGVGVIEHPAIYLLMGIVLWSFFTEATNQGMQAIVSRGDLIRKINFPKYIIVISGTISALINLLFNLVVLFVFALFNGVAFHMTTLLLPFDVGLLYVLALSIAFLLSAAFVKFRDISYIWDVVMQAAFYVVPIIYPMQMVLQQSPLAAKAIMLNPVATILQDARYNVITPTSLKITDLIHNPAIVTIPFVIIGLLIIIAVLYFRHNSRYFAENV